MYYLKNAIEIVKSGNNDPDLLLMAKTTIKQELKKTRAVYNRVQNKRT